MNKNNTLENNSKFNEAIKSALIGVAIGDALGVPYEFSSRENMAISPATDMIGYGTYKQPAGTWSDDSSLTFCLAEGLNSNGYDLSEIALNFCNWRNNNYWTAHNDVFDIGITTAKSLNEIEKILDEGDLDKLKNLRSNENEYDNGNGSLMRIMPLLFYILGKPIQEQYNIVWEISALTHKHERAAMSCMIYLKLAEFVYAGLSKNEAYNATQNTILNLWEIINYNESEKTHFQNIIQNDIRKVPVSQLLTGGYVIEVLESSIYFFLNCNSYADTVLSIINLGHDTDTSAAIAGGLAGIYYGYDNIPAKWITKLARKDDILDLANRLTINLKS